VAHTYNPYYSEGRDQEDCSSKAAPEKQFIRLYLKKKKKKKNQKKGLVEWLKVYFQSSNPSTTKNKSTENKDLQKKRKNEKS
jgi:hypothetical protein